VWAAPGVVAAARQFASSEGHGVAAARPIAFAGGDPRPPGAGAATSSAPTIELVEEIPTGHATALALEVTSIVVEPAASPCDPASEVPALVPHALGAPRRRSPGRPPGGGQGFVSAAEHLTALLDLVTARAALAIATRWRAARLRGDPVEPHPAEREVWSLAAMSGDGAEQLAQARRQLAHQVARVDARAAAGLAAGTALPVVELSAELALPALATELLVAALAPRARGEIRRLYRILADDDARSICDDALLATLLADGDPQRLDALYAELASGSSLVRHGLVMRDARGGLDVDDAVLARLRGQPAPASAATALRAGELALDELIVDRAALRTLVLELAAPRAPDEPVRVVIRGRRGTGRHTTLAALAALVDRPIACIDATQLPLGSARAPALRRELTRAVVAGAIPVVSGLELRGTPAPEVVTRTAQVLRAHPGPLVVRARRGAALPLAPGFVDLELTPRDDRARQRAFAHALDRHAIAASPELLSARHRASPGTIARAAAAARRQLDGSDEDPAAVLDAALRRELAARAGSAAFALPRLATWDQLRLPAATLDGLRALIGRVRQHDRAHAGCQPTSAAPGLTTLFYGPPGTGKTMAASVVARELGRSLVRVDLAALPPAPDPERALDDLFDAAQDGDWLLVFEQLDRALASTRLDACELRRRLDAFDGVAVLEASAPGGLEPALERALPVRLGFPFPDEALRAQLWAACISPRLPIEGQLDPAALAHRYPLSGGGIHRAALRAWLLASEEQSALTQSHLERAAALELHERSAATRVD